MEAYTHRFNQGTGTRCEQSGRNHFLPRQHDILAHGTIALHAQCLVMLAGIDTSIAAGSTLPTIGIGVTSNDHARLQSLRNSGSYLLNDSSYLMTRNDWHLHHGVLPQISAEVRTTETDIL